MALTPQVMILLGFAGVGSVLARWIAVSSGGSTSKGITANQDHLQKNMFWQMLSTNGVFDLLKLKLFAFTVVMALFVIERILDSAAFPALDANTLLMGVSQGAYVTGKLVTTSPLATAQTIQAEIVSLNNTVKN